MMTWPKPVQKPHPPIIAGGAFLIRAHTGEGRERAKARGQSLGRPFKLTPHQRSAALRRRDRGETLTNIARSYNSETTYTEGSGAARTRNGFRATISQPSALMCSHPRQPRLPSLAIC